MIHGQYVTWCRKTSIQTHTRTSSDEREVFANRSMRSLHRHLQYWYRNQCNIYIWEAVNTLYSRPLYRRHVRIALFEGRLTSPIGMSYATVQV